MRNILSKTCLSYQHEALKSRVRISLFFQENNPGFDGLSKAAKGFLEIIFDRLFDEEMLGKHDNLLPIEVTPNASLERSCNESCESTM